MKLSIAIETLQKALARIDKGSGSASFTSTEHDRLVRALASLSSKAVSITESMETIHAYAKCLKNKPDAVTALLEIERYARNALAKVSQS